MKDLREEVDQALAEREEKRFEFDSLFDCYWCAWCRDLVQPEEGGWGDLCKGCAHKALEMAKGSM